MALRPIETGAWFLLRHLIHLNLSGGMLALPKFTPVRVKSAAEQDSKAYSDLVAAYGSHSAEKLRKCIEQHAATFNAVRGTVVA